MIKATTFPITLEQKRNALHYLIGLADEESKLASYLSEASHTEMLIALNYFLDLVLNDIMEDVRNAEQ